MTVVVALALIAFVVYGLERTHRRRPHPRRSPPGAVDVPDRDAERVRAELRAAAGRVPRRARRGPAVR